MQWKRVSCLHTIHQVPCGGSWFIVVHVDHLMQLLGRCFWLKSFGKNHSFVCVCFTWILHMLNNSMQRGKAQIMHNLDCRMCKFLIILEACDLIILHAACHLQNDWNLLQGIWRSFISNGMNRPMLHPL
jgi:hypothetical protein